MAPPSLRILSSPSIDCCDIQPVNVSDQTRSLIASAVSCHQDLPLIAVATKSFVAIYDVSSGLRLLRMDLKSQILELAFTPGLPSLIVACLDWQIHSIWISDSKARVLIPRRMGVERGLEAVVLAPMPPPTSNPRAHNSILFFCKYGGEVLRACYSGEEPSPKAPKDSGNNWGSKLKLDVSKPILGLTCHPSSEGLVMVLHADGVLRGYSAPDVGGGSLEGQILALVYAVQIQEPVQGKNLPAIGTLRAVPHPQATSGCIILQSTRLGSVCILEQVGGNSPSTLIKTQMQGWLAILGMGVVKAEQLVLVFGLTDAGKVRAGAWCMLPTPSGNKVTLSTARVSPSDIGLLLDQSTSARAAIASASAPPSLIDLPSNGSKPGGGGGGVKQLPLASWQGMWSPSPAWATEVSEACILEPHLAPMVLKIEVLPCLGVSACLMEPSLLVQTAPTLVQQTFSAMTKAELELSRLSSSVPLLSLVPLESHFGGCRELLPVASPMHSDLTSWSLKVPGCVLLKPLLYYVSEGNLMQYNLGSIDPGSASILSLPLGSSFIEGNTTVPINLFASYMVQAASSGALAIFFAPDCSSAVASLHQWQWTLILPGQLVPSSASSAVWLKPGKYGAFVGPSDEHFVVVEPTGRVAAVFETSQTKSARSSPIYTLGLEDESCTVAGPLFSGPPCRFLPSSFTLQAGLETVEEEYVDSDEEEAAERAKEERQRQREIRKQRRRDEKKQFASNFSSASKFARYGGLGLDDEDDDDDEPPTPTAKPSNRYGGPIGGSSKPPGASEGLGVLIWVTRDGSLVASTLPCAGEGGVSKGQHHASLDPQALIRMGPGERIVQVAWQTLVTPPCTPSAPDECVCALLTTRRVLILTADLKLHCQVDLLPPSASLHISPSCPATSLLWAGPLLLYLTNTGIVMQVPWTGGEPLPVCQVAPSESCVLLGATPDSIILLRNSSDYSSLFERSDGHGSSGNPYYRGVGAGTHEVVRRAVHLSQAMAIAWATLAASGLGGSATASSARQSLALLFGSSDLRPTFSLVNELRDSGNADFAVSLLKSPQAKGLSSDTSALLSSLAAAGQRWSDVAAELKSISEKSIHDPSSCPPPGSPLALQLRAAAAGAASQGDLVASATFLSMAGDWVGASIIAASLPPSSQRAAAAAVAAAAKASADPEVSALVAQVASCLSSPGSYGSAYGFTSPSPSRVKLMDPQGEDLLPFVGPFALLGSTLGTRVGSDPASTPPPPPDGSQRTTTSVTTLVQFLGLPKNHEVALDAAAIAITADALAPAPPPPIIAGAPTGKVGAPNLSTVSASRPPVAALSSQIGSNFDLEALGRSLAKTSLPPPPSASKPSTTTNGGGIDLLGIDEDLDGPSGNVARANQPGMKATQVKPSGANVSAAFDDLDDFFGGGSSRSTLPPPSSSRPPLPPPAPILSQGVPPPLPVPVLQAPAPPPLPPPAPRGPPADPTKLYLDGVAAMERADWNSSSSSFSHAMAVVASVPLSSPARDQRLSFCAMYLAAVNLLSSASDPSCSLPKQAQVYRHLAALKLDDRHAVMLGKQAAATNKSAGNNRMAADLYMSLIGKALSSATSLPDNESFIAQLQHSIEECDRAAATKPGLVTAPPGEDVEAWARKVSAALSSSDVNLAVASVLNLKLN